MNATIPELFDSLVDALPLEFLSQLKQRLPSSYEEAYQMAYAQTPLEESEAEYLMPHNRRAVVEVAFRNTALDNGLKAGVQKNIRGTSTYTFVRAGNFYFTTSYVNESRKVRPAHFRNQHATLNYFSSQLTLKAFDTIDAFQPIPDTIYCILLHGSDEVDKKRLSFVEFAVPDANNKKWLDRFSLEELVQSKTERTRKVKLEEQDYAIPILKQRGDQGEK